jgi:hypothetical protein
MDYPQTTIEVPRSRRFAQMKRPRIVRNAWFGTRYLLGSYALTYPLLRFTPAPYERVIVERDHDACIDALPRSANTFGAMAFMERNQEVNLAHHMHVAHQFRRAVRLGVPCAVLIREPLENLTSLVIAGENDLSHDLAYRVYIHYYRRVAAIRDQLALCTFEEVRDDPAVIARRLNEKFETSFNGEPTDEQEKQAVVNTLSHWQELTGSRPAHGTIPSDYKENLKPSVRAALARHRLRPTAEVLYRRLADSIEAA